MMPANRQYSPVRKALRSLRLACALLFWAMLLFSLAGGCKQKQNDSASSPFSKEASQPPPGAYFKTPFQDESQYIVEAVAADLAEMVFYAQHHKLPDPKLFSVEALEKPGSKSGTPAYALKISLEKREPLQINVDINGPIWSASVYEGLTSELAKNVGLGPSLLGLKGDTALLQKLTDGLAETVEQENQTLSTDLQGDFVNPVLHEKAAVLLGAFALREHSGVFFDIRAPLCRATAHLALAHFLNGDNPTGVNGSMAECMLLTLMNNQMQAVEKLGAMERSDAALTNWVRALLARNTSDYRPLMAVKSRTTIENIALFQAYALAAKNDTAWTKLGPLAYALPDCARISEEERFSVGVGNFLLQVAVPIETNEIKSVYKLAQGRELADKDLVAALNRPPDRCFAVGEGESGKVHIIGWGLWALLLQHHLCQALTAGSQVLANYLGLPDDAKNFNELADQTYDGLRFYPFVRRFNCLDEAAYHKSVDDGFKITVATPQLTPATCWNYLCYKPYFAREVYRPNPNPHVNEWHKFNPPPGTAYNLLARIDHPSFTGNRQRVAAVHELAPFNTTLCDAMVRLNFNKNPTYEQAGALYEKLLPYSAPAMRMVAGTLKGEPQRYEELLEKAGDLDPSVYGELGDFAWNRNETNQAMSYYDEGAARNPDSVAESSHARRRIYYYMSKGETNNAKRVAHDAGETYSYNGLAAEGDFYEWIGEYETALAWYVKIEERYNDADEVNGFCSRHSEKTGNAAFDQEVEKRLKAWSKLLEKVSLKNFSSPPDEGVEITSDSDLLNNAGMKKGDVIVAINGLRVRNAWQYTTARDLTPDPLLTIIVWQDGRYREIKSSPPNHKFGTSLGNYKAN